METSPRILAINPGSRFVGLAVLDGTELRDWAVRSLAGKTVGKRVRSVESLVRSLAEKHSCRVIGIKSPVNRSTESLRQVTTTVERTANSLKIDCLHYSIIDTKRSILGTSRSNKNRLIDEIVLRYPFLCHEQARLRKSRNPHYIRMFEAVAIGILCAAAVELGAEKVKGRKEGRRRMIQSRT